jgi:hypothetical protein
MMSLSFESVIPGDVWPKRPVGENNKSAGSQSGRAKSPPEREATVPPSPLRSASEETAEAAVPLSDPLGSSAVLCLPSGGALRAGLVRGRWLSKSLDSFSAMARLGGTRRAGEAPSVALVRLFLGGRQSKHELLLQSPAPDLMRERSP